MAGPQDSFSIPTPSRGPVRDHPLVDNSEGSVLPSPSRAILHSQRDGEPIHPGVPILRTTFDFYPLAQHRSAPSYFYHLDSSPTGNTTGQAEPSNSSWVVRLRGFIWVTLHIMYTLGTYRLFFAKFKFKERGPSSSEVIFDSSYAQWVKTVRRMCSVWRLTRVGCGLLLPLSIALLQIDGVIDTVFVRTCTITTAIFAAAGLLSSGIYLFLRSEFKNQRTRTKWVEASRRSSEVESIEFWTFLTLPLTSLIWAVSSCAITVVCLAWTRRNSDIQESDDSFIASAVFITTLTIMTLVHLYKAAQLLECI